MDLVVVWVAENDFISVLVDRHLFGFCVAVDNDLFLASGSKLTGFLCGGVEIDLMVEWGSKLT